ncbi:MAG: SDR family NAD(P)-dependent oxidoreductase [Verrucomicrobiae bacterium]|nr:SDR family NAD(P)-dependent oxidoreductase [Verrucomicrobiae bacterium]NNJ86245.1 SDR family NAD(P)-dependent oxidoreductase [Akkermansiaceae bacterium]
MDDREKAIISGASGCLGQATSVSLSAAGFDVLAPGKQELDVTSSDSIKAYLAEAGEVDLLVCNAGLTIDKPLARMTESDWSRVMDVNLKGAFLCAREVSRGMIKRRAGHIVFISSFSAIHPPAGQVNYATAKAALLGMMKSMAQELGPRNIRVNAILPGFLATRMTAELPDKVKQAALERHTLGRLNTPEAVGDFIAYLHQHLPHTSGQVFNLDSRIV